MADERQFTASERIGPIDKPDSPLIDEETAADGCYRDGKRYSFGQEICVAHYKYMCSLDGFFRRLPGGPNC